MSVVEILRYTRNAWGQQVLEGISLDLVWVFAGAALIFIVAHMAYIAHVRRIRSR